MMLAALTTLLLLLLAAQLALALESPAVTVRCDGGTPFPAQPSTNRYFPNIRPPAAQRAFSSPAIEATIAWARENLADQALAELYTNTYPNTADTTMTSRFYPPAGKNLTFVITGDIDAMWLRDSTNQLLSYINLASIDAKLSSAISETIERQLYYVAHDQYANAFQADNASAGPHAGGDSRTPPYTNLVFEGKYEVDSLAAVLKLLRTYCGAMGKLNNNNNNTSSCVDFLGSSFAGGAPFIHASLVKLLRALVAMQSPTATAYAFRRHHDPGHNDDLFPHNKVGFTGMVRSAFRPSDDECIYDFLVPSNLMLAVELKHLVAAVGSSALFADVAAMATKLRSDILSGVEQYAVQSSGVLSFEVDGLGGRNNMDDANLPSLLSLPYIGVGEAEVKGFGKVYDATRRAVLSKPTNQYYYAGPLGAGPGSPHTWPDFVWPLGLTDQLITALYDPNGHEDAEILGLLDQLKRSAIGAGVLHESFSVYNTSVCTRNWFAWANSYFGQAVNALISLRPDLALKFGAAVPAWFPKPVV
jgi:meiotically up-regulated gene 157 (Mug157) protein